MDEMGWESEGPESRRRLEGIVASAMDAIITINEEHRVVLFNPAAAHMFGVPSAEALGENISRFIPERFRAGHDEHIRRFRKTGVTGRRMGSLGAINGLRADGTEFPVEASISQVDMANEKLATVILRDITERLANEEARLLLAREVDHRAKNALAVVQALVSLTPAPTKEEFVLAVQGRVAALGRAHSLLAQNRWVGGDLEKVVADESRAYCKPGQLTCSGPSIVLVPNAVQPISLLIHELATNAVKYGALASDLGKVLVHWKRRPDDHLVISWQEEGAIGVTEPKTLGFGSTLIDSVARQLEGKVSTEWRHSGVHVAVMLPPASYKGTQAIPAIQPDDTPSPKEAEMPLGRLLIVEDEILVAMELTRALKTEGWEVIGPVGTVEKAFEMLASDEHPDAAILDVNLNGQLVYPVADLLRTRGIPYLFCTGYEAPEQLENHRNSPIVRKPTNLRILLNALRTVLGRPVDPGYQIA